MSSVSAVFENGIFRPLDQVDLPEATRVEIPLPEQPKVSIRPELAALREVLAERYKGELDDSSRIDPALK